MRGVWGLLFVAALVFGAAAPASALSYVKLDPRYNNMHVAGCPTADTTRCIQTNGLLRAASVWCRAHGMSHATNYKTDAVRGRPGAFHMETGTTCQHPNCIMFTEIICTGQAASRPTPAPTPTPAVQPVRINRPMMNGRIVDWCWTWAANCGATAAHVVCRQLGYGAATYYATYLVPGGTFVMGSSRFCQGPSCRGFNYVMCTR